MAGIITNVDSDIQKLRDLKKEIERVKQALKGIDVKVDVDIAKDLEAQLKSLTGQYDELSKKVAEIDGKIKLSTKSINESTEKIIKAQESILKASQSEKQSSNTQTATVTNVQTAAVQAQAVAYADLKEEIDKVLGSRAENIKRLVNEEANIKRLKKQIAELAAKQDTVGLSKSETQRLRDLNNSLIESKIAVSQLNQVLRNDAKIGQSAADSMTRLGQELGRMRMAYRELTDEEKDSPFGRVLKASIEEADAKIKELDASIGNHQRNVGNYASSWNGLSFSIQQLARELPSLAYGPTVFFSAISNNLPMLTDEIKRAREEYQKMVAAGQKGTPVWKQVAKSIVSWQTLLVAGITILTMHGDKIIEWVGKLFKGSNAALSAEKALKKLNEALDFKDLGTDLANFQRLVNLYRDLGDNAEEKKKFIEKFKDELNDTGIAINSVAEADKLLIENTPEYIKAITLRAKANAAMKLAATEMEEAVKKQVKNQEKIKELQQQIEDVRGKKGEGYKEVIPEIRDVNGRILRAAGERTGEEIIAGLQIQIDKLSGASAEAAGQTYLKLMEDYTKQADELIKKTGLTTTDDQAAKNKAAQAAAEATKARQQAQENANNIILNQQKANQDAEIKLMAEGSAKKIAQLNLEYDRLIQAINENEQKVRAAQGGKLTPEQSAVFSAARGSAKQTRDAGIAAVREEENKEVERLLKEYQSLLEKYKETDKKFAKDRAKLVAAGTSQETIAELDYQRDKALDAISLELAKREETFQAWMNQIANYSLEELRRALVLAEQELAMLEKSSPNSKKAIIQRGKVVELRGKVEKAEAETSKNGPKKTDKEWKALYQTLREVEGQFKEIGDTIGGTVGMVISAAGEIASSTLSMIDGIRALTDGSIEAIKGASEAATKALQSVERASIILAIVGSALKIMTKISELSKSSGYEKMKNEYEELISAWDELIERKLEYLNLSYGEEAKMVEEETLEVIQKQIDAYKELAKERMDSDRRKSRGTLGRRMMRENYLSSEAQQELKDAGYGDLIGINKGYDLLNLTGEQLKDLMNNATQFWLELDEEVRRYLEGIIEGYDKIADTEKKLQEQLTAISFDGLYDSFMNTLMDMDASSEDFAEDLSEMLTKALLSEVIGNKYKDKLKKWYESWAASMEGGLSDHELSTLREEYQGIVQDAIRERDALAAFTGYGSEATSEQKATYGGFETMSEETGTELNGRFTALQMAGEEIKREAIAQTITLNEIKGSLDAYMAANGGPGVQTSLDNILTFVSQSYIELQQINQNTAENVSELKKVVRQINRWDSKIMSL